MDSNFNFYKKSCFNLVKKSKEKYVVYNTFTGAMVSLDELHFNQYKFLCNNELNSNLQKGGFIVKENINELAKLKDLSEYIRCYNDVLSLTIAPTLKCNFCCPYCYEKNKDTPTMSLETADKVVNFIIRKMKDLNTKNLFITWYGGEPLLEIGIIEYIFNKLVNRDINISSAIVTNGYYLSESIARKLKMLNVEYAQITIDGPPDIHNIRRCLPSKKDTFFKILNNIRDTYKFIGINIRVNLDKENMYRMDELLDYLDEFNLKNNVGVYVAQVDNINDTYKDNICLKNTEFSTIELQFYKNNYKRGYTFVNLPSANPNICGAVNKNSFVIDPQGNLYKCWDEIGSADNMCGNVDGYINENVMSYWNNYNFVFYEDCKKCEFIPICMGGCPHNNKVTNNKNCTALKYNYKELIELRKEIFYEKINDRDN